MRNNNNIVNQLGTLSLIGDNIIIEESGAIDLGDSTVAGTLNVTSAGPITDSGILNVTGTTTLNAGGNDITLDSTGNEFGSLELTGNNVTIQENAPTNLGTSTLGGTLNVTSAGQITDRGSLNVTGDTTILT